MPSIRLVAPLLVLILVAGCAPEEEVPLGPPTYIEDDNNGNDSRTNPEEVDIDWEDKVLVEGELDECGEFSGGGGGSPGSFDGDLDYFEIEVPDDGWLEIVLDWTVSADLGMSIRVNGGRASYRDDEGLEGPEEWYPEDQFENNDDIVVGVYCTEGDGGAYVIEAEMEY